jgi:Low-density lipoprotein receptor domain class A
MRNKHATLAVGFVGLFCLATACGDDGGSAPSGNEAGESGAGAAPVGGGNGGDGKSAGSGGTMSSNGGEPPGGAASGNGGEAMSRGGEPSGDAGQASADGGKSSADGGEPSGGNPTGNGGEGSGQGGAGGDGGSGPAGCTALTLDAFGQAQVELSYAVYVASFTPNLVTAAADNFRVAIQGPPYDGDRTGTFDLTQNGDDNYRTCARCLLVYADGGQKIFYPSQGTLEIAPGSKALGGTINATITNLELVEVTIADDLTSTPVPDGACLTVASAAVQVEAPPCGGFECNNGYCVANSDYECDAASDCPDDSDEFPVNPSCEPVWLCPQEFYGDGDCDCGCGIQDVDCNGTTDENECEYCSACQGNVNSCGDDEVDPADTTQCL